MQADENLGKNLTKIQSAVPRIRRLLYRHSYPMLMGVPPSVIGIGCRWDCVESSTMHTCLASLNWDRNTHQFNHNFLIESISSLITSFFLQEPRMFTSQANGLGHTMRTMKHADHNDHATNGNLSLTNSWWRSGQYEWVPLSWWSSYCTMIMLRMATCCWPTADDNLAIKDELLCADDHLNCSRQGRWQSHRPVHG